eukprot:15324366-Ditylum_brightwellii.AAC.1
MDIPDVGGNYCRRTRHSSLKEWIKVSSGVIPILIVVPNRGTFVLRRGVLRSFGQGLTGQG